MSSKIFCGSSGAVSIFWSRAEGEAQRAGFGYLFLHSDSAFWVQDRTFGLGCIIHDGHIHCKSVTENTSLQLTPLMVRIGIFSLTPRSTRRVTWAHERSHSISLGALEKMSQNEAALVTILAVNILFRENLAVSILSSAYFGRGYCNP